MNENSSNNELSDNDSNIPIKKTKAKWRRQAFCPRWKEEFKDAAWLANVEDDKYKVKCLACNKILSAGKSEIQKHMNTALHQRNVKSQQTIKNIDNIFVKKDSTEKIEAEIRYALLAAEHNLSFRAMEHIISINKLIFKNDPLSKEIKVHRTKCTSIVKNVIAENIKYNISNEMKNKHFSVFVDESTDSSSDKNLCILVKYCNDSNIKIQLLDYIKLSTKGATAKNLFNSFHDCLKNFNLDIKNIVGFCSDNANVMLGKNNSFASHLLSVNKNIFILGCICHSTHLMASAAAEQLPTNVEGLMHSLYTYFSKSPKRQAILVELQEYFQSQKHKIINPSKTRWLALLNAVQSSGAMECIATSIFVSFS